MPNDSQCNNEPTGDAIPQKDVQSRKWLLTFQESHIKQGFTHERIKEVLSQLKSIKYGCIADEIGLLSQTEEAEPKLHCHLFISCSSPIRGSTLNNIFPSVHRDVVKGTPAQNRDYVAKINKWEKHEKRLTKLADTFEEWGEVPVDRQGSANSNKLDYAAVLDRIQDGASNVEILKEFPQSIRGLRDVDYARLSILEDENRETWRTLEVTYISGETGTGKTRYVMEKYGYTNVYRVTNYRNPFDEYRGQDVLCLDEYWSQLPIQELLNYLDGYPIALPARYSNKQAAYTKVYIISNADLKRQYKSTQYKNPSVWYALIRRIHKVLIFEEDGQRVEYTDVKAYVRRSVSIVTNSEYPENPFMDIN